LAGQVLVIHERVGFWARHLRPRLFDRPARVIETRSTADLESALGGAGVACPVVVIELGRRVRSGLDDLQRAMQIAPGALILVLDPLAHEGVALLAREAGAAHVIGGPVTPPEVAALVVRWLTLAVRRGEAEGWSGASATVVEAEPWNWLAPILALKR
jgi:hypothetical protein